MRIVHAPPALDAPDALPDRPPPPGYRADLPGLDEHTVDGILRGARHDESYVVAPYLEHTADLEARPLSGAIIGEDDVLRQRRVIRRRAAFTLRPEHGYYAWDVWTADDGVVAFTSDPADTRWIPNPGSAAYVWRWVRDTMTAHRQHRAAVHDDAAAAARDRGELLARFVPLDGEVDRATADLVAYAPQMQDARYGR